VRDDLDSERREKRGTAMNDEALTSFERQDAESADSRRGANDQTWRYFWYVLLVVTVYRRGPWVPMAGR
jgi:hypothetical protein